MFLDFWGRKPGKQVRNSNTSISSPRLNSLVLIGCGTNVSPTRTGIQEIVRPKRPTGSVEVRNTQMFNTSINGNSAKKEDPTPTFSKLIGRELSHDSRVDIYLRCPVNFTHYAVGTESPNFMNLGISSVHTSDELRSFIIPDTRITRPVDGSNWILSGHLIGEVTESRMSGMRSEQNYSSKTDFETRREIKILSCKIFLWVSHLWTQLLLV